MQAQYSERIHNLLVNGPSVGDLLELCEENYRCLHSLAPQLKRLQGKHCSSRPDHQDLHLTILEQTKRQSENQLPISDVAPHLAPR